MDSVQTKMDNFLRFVQTETAQIGATFGATRQKFEKDQRNFQQEMNRGRKALANERAALQKEKQEWKEAAMQEIEQARTALAKEKSDWKRSNDEIVAKNGDPVASEVVEINVGGQTFTTLRGTLCRYPNSMLGVMFGNRATVRIVVDKNGRVFIDRNGRLFEYILDWLRTGIFPDVPERDTEAVERELDYYGLLEFRESDSVAPVQQANDVANQQYDIEVDTSSLDPKDIELAMSQLNLSHDQAARALLNHSGDIIDGITELTM